MDNYRIYGLIIVKTARKLLMLDYGFSNTTFEPPDHVFALIPNMMSTFAQFNSKSHPTHLNVHKARKELNTITKLL